MTIIYTNGLIHTMDPALPRATAVAVDGGRIAGVGSTEEIRLQFGRAGVEEIDLDGVIYENASRPFFGAIPKRTYAELKDALRLGVKHALASGLTTGDGDQWVNIGAMKIFADGAMGGRTALMSVPNADAPGTYGQAIHTQEELNALAAAGRMRRVWKM